MAYSDGLLQLLGSLNEYQVEAVNVGQGQASLVGVPGSGKTRTLVARTGRLAEDGLDPDYVLAMTFTRAAAAEMTARLHGMGIERARVGTIHSVCRQIAAAETDLLEHGRVDERGKMTIELKKLLSELRRRGAIARFGVDFEGVSRFIESCKAGGLCYVDGDPFGLNGPAEQYLLEQGRRWARAAGVNSKMLATIFVEYERRRGSLNLYDFDDMLLWAWMELVADQEARLRWRQRWSVVIVDECFDGRTPVTLADGTARSIREIVDSRYAGKVLSYNPASGNMEPRSVIGWHKVPLAKRMVRVVARQRGYARNGARLSATTEQVRFGLRYLLCTEDQLVLRGQGSTAAMVPAAELRVGDLLTLESGAPRVKAYAQAAGHGLAGRDKLARLMREKNRVGACGGNNSHGRVSIRGGNGAGPSPVERAVLAKLGEGWETGVAVPTGFVPHHYKIDVAHREMMIAIELDGRSHSSPKRRAADRRKDARLQELGWTVIRLRNRDALRLSACEILQLGGRDACPVPAEVLSVELWQPTDAFVYDIDVEGTHTLLADGLVVHNCQDSNPIQWDIARLLVGLESCIESAHALPSGPTRDEGAHNLMVAGDPSQCQPPGTRIEVPGEPIGDGKGWRRTQSHSKNLEAVKVGDLVRSWSRRQQAMTTRRVRKVAKRWYEGPLLYVSTRSGTTRVTPNHRFLCRWAKRGTEVCVTYLMLRKGYGYRVGWCKLFSGERGYHLSQRARLEKADALWILGAHRARAEASLEESRIAAHYGLPTITFESHNGAALCDRRVIKRLFLALRGENAQRGERCLRDFGRDPGLPFWPWPNKPTGAYLRATYFEVFAANLLPGLMSVPTPTGRNRWTVLDRIESRPYKGYVHSLDVEGNHSYAADGIVVLNSIYKWRAAEPSLFVKYAKEPDVKALVLPLNYRSNQTICSVASGIVRNKVWHLGGEIVSTHTVLPPKAITVRRYDSVEEEAEDLVRRCIELAQDGAGLRSCAILSRLRVGLDLVEIACIRHRIRYIKMAAGSFFESREVRDVLAYLRVAANLDPDGTWLRHIVNRPFRYIGANFINKAAAWADMRGLSLIDGLEGLSDELNFKQRQAIRDLYGLLRDLNSIAVRAESRYQAAERELAARRAMGEAGLPETAEGWLTRQPPPKPPEPSAEEGSESQRGPIDTGRFRNLEGDEELISSDTALAMEGPADMIALVLRKTDYIEELRREQGLLGLDESRIAALAALRRMAFMFSTTAKFLAYVDALTVAVEQARRVGLKLQEGAREDALVLSTIHRAKGLEFKHVFLMDVVQGRFPCTKSMDPDEELRLLYVAITRAMEGCQVSYTGPAEESEGVRSSFILLIERELENLAKSVRNGAKSQVFSKEPNDQPCPSAGE